MILKYGKRKISIKVKKVSFLGKYLGLMFRSNKTKCLLFEFTKYGKWGIHSFFVFFPFLAVWLDEKNNVLEWRVVRPFKLLIKPRKKFIKLVEIPLSDINRSKIFFFVGKGKI